jgi:hypothetical protein
VAPLQQLSVAPLQQLSVAPLQQLSVAPLQQLSGGSWQVPLLCSKTDTRDTLAALLRIGRAFLRCAKVLDAT